MSVRFSFSVRVKNDQGLGQVGEMDELIQFYRHQRCKAKIIRLWNELEA